jgi:hypothetical protein
VVNGSQELDFNSGNQSMYNLETPIKTGICLFFHTSPQSTFKRRHFLYFQGNFLGKKLLKSLGREGVKKHF